MADIFASATLSSR